MRFMVLFIFMLFVAPYAVAQDQSARALLEGLAERTPGTMLGELRDNPAAFLEEGAGVILGYGTAKGIGPAGLEDAVSAARARVRAREMRRMLQADLDSDLDVDAREIDVAIRTASATMRGRLLNWHLTADISADGTVSWGELRGFAQDASMRAVSEDRAQAIRALMVFDLDGDGFVTVVELREAITLLGDPA